MKHLISTILFLSLFLHPTGRLAIAQGAMYPNYSNVEKVQNFIVDAMLYGKGSTELKMFRMANLTLGYQSGYSSWNQLASHSFDLNARVLFLSGGYTRQNAIGKKGYIGLGLGDLFNVQYGYAFNTHNHLLRVRSDCEVVTFFSKKVSYLMYFGVYAEKSFGNNQYNGYSVGITVGISLLTPFILVGYLMNG